MPGWTIVAIGILFVIKFVSGFGLNRMGKPYSVALLTLHKIISLLTVVVIALAIRRVRGYAGLGGIELGAIIATGLLFLLTIASGGVLSADRPAIPAGAIAHKVVPFLTVVLAAATVYLVGWGSS